MFSLPSCQFSWSSTPAAFLPRPTTTTLGKSCSAHAQNRPLQVFETSICRGEGFVSSHTITFTSAQEPHREIWLFCFTLYLSKIVSLVCLKGRVKILLQIILWKPVPQLWKLNKESLQPAIQCFLPVNYLFTTISSMCGLTQG